MVYNIFVEKKSDRMMTRAPWLFFYFMAGFVEYKGFINIMMK